MVLGILTTVEAILLGISIIAFVLYLIFGIKFFVETVIHPEDTCPMFTLTFAGASAFVFILSFAAFLLVLLL